MTWLHKLKFGTIEPEIFDLALHLSNLRSIPRRYSNNVKKNHIFSCFVEQHTESIKNEHTKNKPGT